ncbi:hypothetical protein XENOCAPTIV_003971 [Xenoophorus captivus]|uniref:Secreted protein n=1 Tax=Xenoophorus captivus TaxID=1517983 RepID=A0ABV0R6P8_9TELE
MCVYAAVLLLWLVDTVLPSVSASGGYTSDEWDVCWTAVLELLSDSFFLLQQVQSPPTPRFTPPTGLLLLSSFLLVSFSSPSLISLLQHLCMSVRPLAELEFFFLGRHHPDLSYALFLHRKNDFLALFSESVL